MVKPSSPFVGLMVNFLKSSTVGNKGLVYAIVTRNHPVRVNAMQTARQFGAFYGKNSRLQEIH
jgi:hypothetical protein